MNQSERIKTGQPEKITLPRICVCIFFGCFFVGVLCANLGLSDQALWIGFTNENNIRQFVPGEQGISDFLLFALKNRLIPWGIVVVCGAFFWGGIVCAVRFGWFGISAGFLMTALIQRHGFRGILLMGAIGLPQWLIYTSAYLILLKLIRIFQRERRGQMGNILLERKNKKYVGMYCLFSALISGVFFLGILAEYYLSPFILQFIK